MVESGIFLDYTENLIQKMKYLSHAEDLVGRRGNRMDVDCERRRASGMTREQSLPETDKLAERDKKCW